MGLDMYLYLEKSDCKSDLNVDTGLLYPKELKELEQMAIKQGIRSKIVIEKYQVGYWRKANAIHKWFIDHCNDGIEDCDCQDIVVYSTQLEELKNTCEKVLKNHELAEDLLPTQEGFFFGSTEYDDWYFENLQTTIDVANAILRVLDKNTDYEIIYHAWW